MSKTSSPLQFYSLPIIILLLCFSFAYCQESGQSSCSFKFVSDPEGAKVFINGTFLGVTPCKIDTIPPGTYSVKMEKEGYHTKESTEKLSENMHQRIFVQLEEFELVYENTCGVLEINSEPTDAKVSLDNKFLGNTPLKSDSIKAGLYNIKVTT